MKLLELFQINEVDMRPSSLESEAAAIDAVVGIEYEMSVPATDYYSEDSDSGEVEPDMDYDERIGHNGIASIDDVVSFFENGENGSYELNKLRRKLEVQYDTWQLKELESQWEVDGYAVCKEYILDNVFDRDEAIEAAQAAYRKALGSELAPVDNERAQKFIQQHVDEQLKYLIDDHVIQKGRAWDEWEEHAKLDPEAYGIDEYTFLKSEFNKVSDIYYQFDGLINWPYYSASEDNSFEREVSNLASVLEDVVNTTVNWSTTYHNAKRSPKAYSLEPDPSVTSDSQILGMELISPAQSIEETFTDMDNIIDWAHRYGVTTDSSTGLHMNVSLNNRSMDDLDYVKLVILVGDDYLLRKFDRLFNPTAERSFNYIDKMIQSRKDPEEFMKQVRANMTAAAGKTIVLGSTDKYISVHVKSTHVEFRSPGNDWLNVPVDELKATVNRFVVALDAAMDPSKYRKEYLKKLAKFVGQYTDRIDLVNLYVNSVAGMKQGEQTDLKKQFLKRSRAYKDVKKKGYSTIKTDLPLPVGTKIK